METTWTARLRVTPTQRVQLLVTQAKCDLLKANLDTRPHHPRALLTLLEGLSLWSGAPLHVALSANDLYRDGQPSMLFGDEMWPPASPLVRFVVAHRDRRRGRLDGIGDFRSVRSLGQGER